MFTVLRWSSGDLEISTPSGFSAWEAARWKKPDDVTLKKIIVASEGVNVDLDELDEEPGQKKVGGGRKERRNHEG